MEKITKYKGPWWILILMAMGLGLIVLLGFIVHPASATVFIYGSVPNYSAIVLPNNSYVHQGENISQGNYYDLRGVYGFSGQLAHWDKDYSVGQGQPDQIVTLSGTRTTYIDPEKFPTGRWWQWDGAYCQTGTENCVTGFGNGNAYVFAVLPQQEKAMQSIKVTKSANITITSEEGTITVPVTYSEVVNQPVNGTGSSSASSQGKITPAPAITQPTPVEVQDRNGISIPGGVSGAVVVTPKSPVSIAIPMLGIIVGLILVIKRKEN